MSKTSNFRAKLEDMTIGSKIKDARTSLGLTQDDLAERSKINLRTIQRIENNENIPRGKTLELICEVLKINPKSVQKNEGRSRKVVGDIIVNGFFLLLLNLGLTAIFGYLTLAAGANQNSQFAAYLLAVALPLLIVFFTRQLNGLTRMVRFGVGFMAYIIMIVALDGIYGLYRGLDTGIIPSLVIALSILYFGKNLIVKEKD